MKLTAEIMFSYSHQKWSSQYIHYYRYMSADLLIYLHIYISGQTMLVCLYWLTWTWFEIVAYWFVVRLYWIKGCYNQNVTLYLWIINFWRYELLPVKSCINVVRTRFSTSLFVRTWINVGWTSVDRSSWSNVAALYLILEIYEFGNIESQRSNLSYLVTLAVFVRDKLLQEIDDTWKRLYWTKGCYNQNVPL